MKRRDIELCGKTFTVSESDNFDKVVIYEYVNGKAVPIISGDTLKEACEKWLQLDTQTFDNLCVNMELWAKENNLDLGEIGTLVCFKKFVETLSGHEMFAFMSFDNHHYYVDWSDLSRLKKG